MASVNLNKNIAEHLIVISLDGFSTLDFDTMSNLPNFKEYLKKASYCRNVYSVYPSLTYPAHATIVTGKYPKNHSIVNNTLIQPERSASDWYWHRKYIKSSTLYDKAIDNGLTVAALLWPVTAKSRIQYNVPEIFANRPWQNQITVSLLNGSPLYQIILNQKYGRIRKGKKEPELDDFVHQSVLYTINKKKPNLMLIHYTDLDAQRHHYGFNSREADEALLRHDRRLGEIINSLKENGIYEKSTIVVLGDHSSLDESKLIRLNVLLKDNGFIQLDSDNRISQWKAIAKNCDGSTYIYLKDKHDTETLQRVHKVITDYISSKDFPTQIDNGIEALYTAEEASAMGADPGCAFMLEAKKGFYFTDECIGNITEDISNIKPSDNHYTKATHGYSPYKENYTTVFSASGKGIKPGVVIDTISLIDEGPTLARILGLELDNPDGRVLEEMFL